MLRVGENELISFSAFYIMDSSLGSGSISFYMILWSAVVYKRDIELHCFFFFFFFFFLSYIV